MRRIVFLAAGLASISSAFPDEAGLKFDLTPEQARKFNAGPSESFFRDFGDASGPFRSVGSVIAAGSELDSITVEGLPDRFKIPNAGDPARSFHLEFFLSAGGKGYSVIHKLRAADEEDDEDDRPWEHLVLCEAAEHAIASNNTELLRALLQGGLSINRPLDWHTRRTALHYCAVHNATGPARFLVGNGAELEAKDAYGKRAIDEAFEEGETDLCEILRRPSKMDWMIGGLPGELLDQLFTGGSKRRKEILFLSVNGRDPGEELMKHFVSDWPKVRAGSRAEEAPKGGRGYLDTETGESGILVMLELKKTGEDEYGWTHEERSAPFLSGWMRKGKVAKKYGYWVITESEAWDE